MWLLNLLCDHAYILGFIPRACYYIDDILCSVANSDFNLEVVVCTFGGVLNARFGIEGYMSVCI